MFFSFFIVVVQQQFFLLVAGKASKMDGRGFWTNLAVNACQDLATPSASDSQKQTTGARWPNSGPLDPKMAQ
jgi:hypothetical protein